MNMTLIAIVVGIVAVAIGGMLARKRWIRVFLWVLSLPSLGLGLIALAQGGIAEKFTPDVLTVFCTTAFAPIVGCVAGEIIKVMTAKKQKNRKSSNK